MTLTVSQTASARIRNESRNGLLRRAFEPGEQCRVFEKASGGHDSVDAGFARDVVSILERVDVSISQNRYSGIRLKQFNSSEIRRCRRALVFGPAVYSNEVYAGGSDDVDEAFGLVEVFVDADFAAHALVSA